MDVDAVDRLVSDTTGAGSPGTACPSGWLGTHVTTWTSWPAAAHSRQCSWVRVAGALTSGGK